MKYVYLLLLTCILSSCASTPMTQEECVAAGGDMTVEFKKQGWQCCKVVRIDNAAMCKVIKRSNEPKELREPHFNHE